MKRILKPVTYVLAALYFLVDAAFMAIAKPISDWLAGHVVLRRLRAWIRSLQPYPALDSGFVGPRHRTHETQSSDLI